MKALTSLVVILALTAMARADDQKIDLSSMTCRQFIQGEEKTTDVVLAWLLGFYSGENEPQVIDLVKLDSMRKSFTAFCKDQPGFRLTTAAEGILGK